MKKKEDIKNSEKYYVINFERVRVGSITDMLIKFFETEKGKELIRRKAKLSEIKKEFGETVSLSVIHNARKLFIWKYTEKGIDVFENSSENIIRKELNEIKLKIDKILRNI